MLIFERSQPGRKAYAQMPTGAEQLPYQIPSEYLRAEPPMLPECSELQVVRHFTNLSRKNFSIDTHFYPLGSCTMKYNPRGVRHIVSHPGFLNRHPLIPDVYNQGFMSCLYHLQVILGDLTGMKAVSLAPMAGAQGEFAGVAMIRAYHVARGESHRNEIIIPDAAHGTNPASAVMCGMRVREVPTAKNGDLDKDALSAVVGPNTAAIMLTNPSTAGVFERSIEEIADIVHQAGGLLYYDGANLNAILGKVKPGDMGFDVLHMNLHKTFATPHGGGGPGAGPVGVSDRLLPFLPIPYVHLEQGHYGWITEDHAPKTIGRLSTFNGNAGILLRAYAYARLLGKEGLHRVGEYATLNANYMAKRLQKIGFTLAYPERRATHEFIITLQPQLKQYGVTAMDFAKRLLDKGIHAPTTYFPLIIPECLLIEPTETESKEELDNFIDAMEEILNEARQDANLLKNAPHSQVVTRLDDVKAAKQPDLVWHKQRQQL